MRYQRAFRLSFFCAVLLLSNMVSDHAYAQRVWEKTSGYIYYGFPSDTGYAEVLDTLVRTTDGGQSWNAVMQTIYTAAPNLSLAGSNGWLLPYPSEGDLLKTSDDGFTWSTQSTPVYGAINRIIYESLSLGILTTDSSLYLTTDNGQSWQLRSLPPSGDSIFGHVYGMFGMIPSNVIIGSGFDPSNPSEYSPYVSTDTGETWHLVSEPWLDNYIGENTSISFNAYTPDDGLTWDTVQTTAQNSGGGNVFTDTNGHGMFTPFPPPSDSELYFTTDFGHSWDSTKAPFDGINGGLIVDSIWYALGSDGYVYRSPPAPSGVSQTNQPTSFRILTNPATHVLQLSLEEIPDEIRIVDFLGRTVGSYATQGVAFSVDVSTLPAGLYWVVTRSGAQSFVHLNE